MSVKCGAHGGKNHFSTTRGPGVEAVYRCDHQHSLAGEDGSELQCTLCAEVEGCAVAETCSSRADSRCADCSALLPAGDRNAFRVTGSPGQADTCAKCGGNQCGDGKEVSRVGG